MSRPSESPRRPPARPTLTPLFVCSLAFWAACALSYGQACSLEADECFALAVASIAALAVAGAAIVVPPARRYAFIAVSAIVGCVLGLSAGYEIQIKAIELDGYSGEVSATVLDDSANRGFGESAYAEACFPGGQRAVVLMELREHEPLLAGQQVICKGTFKQVDFRQDAAAWREGSAGRFRASACTEGGGQTALEALVQARKVAIGAIGSNDEAHVLLQAVVCGYRHDLRQSGTYIAFQSCGIAHLVAVSGAHLVIVTGLFASVLRAARAPRKVVIVVLVIVMLSYYVIAGMPVSALRACIMCMLGLVSFFGKRRASSLNAIGVSVFLLVSQSPATCISASFALSVLATTGIVLFAPLVSYLLNQTPLVRLQFAGEAMSLCVSASLLAQPYACSLFSQLPVLAPVANCLTAPLFPVVCTLGLLLAISAIVSAAAMPFLDVLASCASEALAAVARFVAGIPFSSVPASVDAVPALAFSMIAALALWAIWPRDARRLARCGLSCLAAGAMLLFICADRSDSVVMLDVGQGDSILVRSRGQSLLVDTGNQDSRLLEQLGSVGVAHVDSVLLTHADDDHCGSLDALRRAVHVDRVIVAADMITSQGDSARKLIGQARDLAPEVVGVQVNDVFHVGAFTVRVVWPRSFHEEGGNADSLCLLVEYDADGDGVIEAKTLMTGDAEKDELAEIIAAGQVGRVDVLKVGHHGSRNGMTEEQVRALSPKVALVSCGLNNRYGHPAPEITSMLDEAGAVVYRTDLQGQVRCAFSGERLFLTTSFSR